MRSVAVLAIVALAASVVVAEEPNVPGDHDVWELSGTDSTVRWLVIHNVEDGKNSGLFHVEVLERKGPDPSWKFKRLAAHMAVTESALRASVQKPLRSGRVYPEQFEQALAAWQKQREAGTAAICDQDVLRCLQSQ